MKEIKIYLDLEKIEKETGRKFDCESEYSDNFLQWIQFLANCQIYLEDENDKKKKATELHDILKNCYSEWDMKH